MKNVLKWLPLAVALASGLSACEKEEEGKETAREIPEVVEPSRLRLTVENESGDYVFVRVENKDVIPVPPTGSPYVVFDYENSYDQDFGGAGTERAWIEYAIYTQNEVLYRRANKEKPNSHIFIAPPQGENKDAYELWIELKVSKGL